MEEQGIGLPVVIRADGSFKVGDEVYGSRKLKGYAGKTLLCNQRVGSSLMTVYTPRNQSLLRGNVLCKAKRRKK